MAQRQDVAPRAEGDTGPSLAAGGSGHRVRLRSRFEKAGFDGFAPHEILEILLTLAIPRRDVKPQARALLAEFGSLRGVLDASPGDLVRLPGVGQNVATALRIIRGASALYLQEKLEATSATDEPCQMEDFWRVRLGGLDHEVFEVAHLDARLRLVRDGVQTIQQGTVDQAIVFPRMVVEAALRRGASAVVIAHNHPAGDPAPSQADLDLTSAISLALATVQVRLIDHIVVGANNVFSMRAAGLL